MVSGLVSLLSALPPPCSPAHRAGSPVVGVRPRGPAPCSRSIHERPFPHPGGLGHESFHSSPEPGRCGVILPPHLLPSPRPPHVQLRPLLDLFRQLRRDRVELLNRMPIRRPAWRWPPLGHVEMSTSNAISAVLVAQPARWHPACVRPDGSSLASLVRKTSVRVHAIIHNEHRNILDHIAAL